MHCSVITLHTQKIQLPFKDLEQTFWTEPSERLDGITALVSIFLVVTQMADFFLNDNTNK